MTLFVVFELNLDTQVPRVRAICTSDLGAHEALKLLEKELASGIRGSPNVRFFIDEEDANRVMVRTGPFNWEIHFLGEPIHLDKGKLYGVSPKGDIGEYVGETRSP